MKFSYARIMVGLIPVLLCGLSHQSTVRAMDALEKQITNQPRGHILTNINVWSPDGQWIVYDTRSDPAGERFDGNTIEIVNADTGEVRKIYRSQNGAHCGVATFSPASQKVAFILGPEHPTDDWQYSPYHRQGVIVDLDKPNQAIPLDARDISPPFTPGALRGGSHVHVFDAAGQWVSFTYEDHVLAMLDAAKSTQPGSPQHDANQRNIGVSAPVQAVNVATDQPRNHSGSAFTVLVTRTVNQPRPGTDEISRACEEGWIGTDGYLRPDGTHQRRALAFQGNLVTSSGKTISEVFAVDLPNDITVPGEAPLEGTTTTRPTPPQGTLQRRLTITANRKYPGLQGPRHWLRSSPDGARIAFLMRDDAGVAQLWTILPNGGEPQQVTRNSFDIASTFSWSLDGKSIAYAADNSIFVTEIAGGETTRLTPKSPDSTAPRPEACVFSPDGNRIAFVRPVLHGSMVYNQIFVVTRK